jgi:N-acetylglucosaminyldiphosphoundecaprenol N-acetyl-beta-D-mannosaminyltransferase
MVDTGSAPADDLPSDPQGPDQPREAQDSKRAEGVLRPVHPGVADLFGVEVDVLTLAQSVDAARALVATGGPHQHVVLNAAKVVAMRDDPALRDVIASCSLVNADGVSVLLAGRVLGQPLPERVTGIDLFQALLSAAETDGSTVFLLGATQEVLDDLESEVRRRHPRLRIVGSHDGYWDDDGDVVRAVRAAAPDYLFLAIPSPRKEFWLNQHLDELGVPFVMGVGGSFDVLAGHVSRAPRIVQRMGLEWAWRWGQEPRRLWKRYVVGNTRFLALLARERWRQR